MSLLDDARQMLEDGALGWHKATKEWICGFCCERLFDPTIEDEDEGTIYRSFTHDPTCPWLSMPKIVAALEVLESLVQTWDEHIHDVNSGSDAAADTVNAAVDRIRVALRGDA